MTTIGSALASTALPRLVDEAGVDQLAASSTPPLWVWLGLLAICIAAVVWLGARYASKTGDALEDSFRSLSRSLRLSRQDRVLLRELGAQTSVAPVAITLSTGAFDHAAAQQQADPDRRLRIARLRDTLFNLDQ